MAELELPADVRPLSLPGVFTAQYEIDTLPLLFSPDALFTEYYDALARKNTHITTQIEDLRAKNRAARELRSSGMWQDCVEVLWSCVEMRKDLFDAKDFQLTAAQRHYIMTLLNFATFFLREGGNGRTSGEEAMFFRSFGLFKKAEEAVTIIDDRPDRMLLKAMIENNYAAYYTRRRKQKAASQRMASAVKAFKIYTESTYGAKKAVAEPSDSDTDHEDDKKHPSTMSDAEFKSRTEALYFAFQSGTGDIFCGRFEDGLKKLMAAVKDAEILQQAVDAPPNDQELQKQINSQNVDNHSLAAKEPSVEAASPSRSAAGPATTSPSRSRAGSSRRSSRSQSSSSRSSSSARYSSDAYSTPASTPRSQPSPQKSSPKKAKTEEGAVDVPRAPSKPASSPPTAPRPTSATVSERRDEAVQQIRSSASAPPEGGFAIQIVGSNAPTDVLTIVGLFHNIAVANVGLRRHHEGARWGQKALDVALANVENGINPKGNIVAIIRRCKDFCDKMSFRLRPSQSQTISSMAKARSNSVEQTSRRTSLIKQPIRGSTADPNRRQHLEEDRKSYIVAEAAFDHPRSAEAARAYLPRHAGKRFKEASAVEKLQTYLKGLSYRQLVEDYQIDDGGKYQKMKAHQASKKDPESTKAEERSRVRMRQEATLQRRTELVHAQQAKVVTPRQPVTGREASKSREATPRTTPAPTPRIRAVESKDAVKTSNEDASAQKEQTRISPKTSKNQSPSETPKAEENISGTNDDAQDVTKSADLKSEPTADDVAADHRNITSVEADAASPNSNDQPDGADDSTNDFEKDSEAPNSPKREAAASTSQPINNEVEKEEAKPSVDADYSDGGDDFEKDSEAPMSPKKEIESKNDQQSSSAAAEASPEAVNENLLDQAEVEEPKPAAMDQTADADSDDFEKDSEAPNSPKREAAASTSQPINNEVEKEEAKPSVDADYSDGGDDFEKDSEAPMSPKRDDADHSPLTPRTENRKLSASETANLALDSAEKKMQADHHSEIDNSKAASPKSNAYSDEYDNFEAESPLKNDGVGPSGNDAEKVQEAEAPSTNKEPEQSTPTKDDYGGDDFDDESPAASAKEIPNNATINDKPHTAQSAGSPDDAEYGQEDFEADAQTPNKLSSKSAASPQSPDYGDDDFEEEL